MTTIEEELTTCGIAPQVRQLPLPVDDQPTPRLAKKVKHLLLTTTEDPFNRNAWSGIPWSLRLALERQVEQLTVFHPPKPKRAPIDVVKRVLFGASRFPLWITKATLKQNASAVRSEIARTNPDAVLSISSQCVAYLDDPGRPVFMFSDAPYWTYCEMYRRWDTPPLRIRKFAEEEARAARRLDGLCFGSGWACGQARRVYGLDSAAAESRLHETPLGANWVPPLERDEVFRRIDERTARFETDGIELLYVGKDWLRKGGPLAVEVATQIHNAGYKVRLHIVGCRPELGEAAGAGGFITVHGLLKQSDPDQSARLAELFLRSDFLIVPTLAECFGIVFAEAQAFGLPPISRAVHAVPSVVLDGKTGMLLDRDAPAGSYVERILSIVGKPQEYRRMARQAREWFEERLRWDRTAEGILEAICGRLAAGASRQEIAARSEASSSQPAGGYRPTHASSLGVSAP